MEDKDVFLLKEIVEFCDRIMDAMAARGNSLEAFNKDLDFQDACAFRIIQIGEYVNSLSDTFKDGHHEMPWRNIVGLRNLLTHDYGSIDNEKMWETIKTDIPPFRDFCAKSIGI